MNKGGNGGNWPSTTGKPSGGGRGNNPPGSHGRQSMFNGNGVHIVVWTPLSIERKHYEVF